jgi:UDP-glucose:O-linked fucose beta-1,3-glucosyltransferase
MKPIFMGHALYDEEATIIHHFAFHENTKSFPYPDLAACFLMNLNMIQT